MQREAASLVNYLSDIIARPYSWTVDEYNILLDQYDSITEDVKKFIISRREMAASLVNTGICQSFEYQGKRAYQEDRMICCQSEYVKDGVKTVFKIYGVFDGHRDVDVAAYLAQNFCKVISEHLSIYDTPVEAIKAAFVYLDHQIYDQRLSGGSTASGAIMIEDTSYVFNLGDSRTIFFDQGRALITRDHKPYNPNEMIRIHNFGFAVVNERIVAPERQLSPRPGGLAVSRGFGDIKYKINSDGKFDPLTGAVSCFPDVMVCGLEKGSYLFSATDGLWDVYSSDQIVEYLDTDPETAITKLYEDVRNNSAIRDNVSIVFTRTS